MPRAYASGCGRSPAGLLAVVRPAAALVGGALAVVAAGCAKEQAPPGALPDRTAPGVREIVPPPGSVVPDFDDDVRVRLDEPVEFSRTYGRQMEASPAYEYRVTTGFSDIRVRPEGGWRRGAVYVLRLPGGFRDLLGNEREEPIEVVFSTGPEVTDTRISGRIRDRLTGQGVRGSRLLVLAAEGDSIPYSAVSDTGGVVSLRSLPPGRYTAYGFEDLNANRSLERRLEPHDSTTLRLDGPSAAAEVSLRLVPPDSTPPALAAAEAVDSLTVVLVFDDPLDPDQDLAGADVAVRPSDEPTPLPLASVGLRRPSPAGPEGRAPGADTLPGDSAVGGGPDAVGDSLPGDSAAARAPEAVPADSAAPGAGADAVGRGTDRPGTADTVPLPSDSLFLRLGRPLEEGRSYRASGRGLLNLRGLAGGGDTTFVYTPPDTAAGTGDAAADSAGGEPPDAEGADAAPPDTAADGGATPPDAAPRLPARRSPRGRREAV